jgi:hypothetical protein
VVVRQARDLADDIMWDVVVVLSYTVLIVFGGEVK